MFGIFSNIRKMAIYLHNYGRTNFKNGTKCENKKTYIDEKMLFHVKI